MLLFVFEPDTFSITKQKQKRPEEINKEISKEKANCTGMKNENNKNSINKRRN
jgi:hypothetical protein